MLCKETTAELVQEEPETMRAPEESEYVSGVREGSSSSSSSDDEFGVSDDENAQPPKPALQCRRPSMLRDPSGAKTDAPRRLSVQVSAMVLDQVNVQGSSWEDVAWQHLNSSPADDPSMLAKKDNIIFLDWDDTLFPTSALGCKDLSGEPTSEQLPALLDHAKLVREFLCSACSVGHVAIITLARRPWVEFSSERFLPGVDWEAEFKALKIPVVYARESMNKLHQQQVLLEEGVDQYVQCKTHAMLKVVKMLSPKRKTTDFNIVSIGDSTIEKVAAREVMWNQNGDHCCKTVKLNDEPSSVEELTQELGQLSAWIASLTSVDGDLDADMDDLAAKTVELVVNSPKRAATAQSWPDFLPSSEFPNLLGATVAGKPGV
eukprot:TRINITY_DN26969_c0_g1_i2.p1 TRINITY_DN26969_c0_g1~~TRINITY_DN26969_c0_g1_i2.p1  ORF type:complete len:376 (-),score=75.78 TRINITY_DN26969_c0_g1_i2:58-1185(-)